MSIRRITGTVSDLTSATANITANTAKRYDVSNIDLAKFKEAFPSNGIKYNHSKAMLTSVASAIKKNPKLVALGITTAVAADYIADRMAEGMTLTEAVEAMAETAGTVAGKTVGGVAGAAAEAVSDEILGEGFWERYRIYLIAFIVLIVSLVVLF